MKRSTVIGAALAAILAVQGPLAAGAVQAQAGQTLSSVR